MKKKEFAAWVETIQPDEGSCSAAVHSVGWGLKCNSTRERFRHIYFRDCRSQSETYESSCLYDWHQTGKNHRWQSGRPDCNTRRGIRAKKQSFLLQYGYGSYMFASRNKLISVFKSSDNHKAREQKKETIINAPRSIFWFIILHISMKMLCVDHW